MQEPPTRSILVGVDPRVVEGTILTQSELLPAPAVTASPPTRAPVVRTAAPAKSLERPRARPGNFLTSCLIGRIPATYYPLSPFCEQWLVEDAQINPKGEYC